MKRPTFPHFAYIREQLPKFIQDEYETFVAFIEAYYEFLEQQSQAGQVAGELLNYRDPHYTIDLFVNDILEEIATGLPENIAADKRLVIQHIHDMFVAKGSKKGFELLFRIMYNDRIEISYPSERILRASDSNWVAYKQIASVPLSGNIANIIGTLVVGEQSGASAIVESTISQVIDGFGPVQFLTLNEQTIDGEFIIGEKIKAHKGLPNEIILQTIKVISGFNIISSGQYYRVGDIVSVNGSSGGAGMGVVRHVEPGVPLDRQATFQQGHIPGFPERIEITTKYFHFLQPGDHVDIEFEVGAQSGSYTVTAVSGDKSFIITTNTNETITGVCAVINMEGRGGIKSIEIIESGANLEGHVVTIDTDQGTGAIIEPIFGPIIKWGGVYRDSRGMISDGAIVLQDNRKFQAFSYVIRTSESIRSWGQTVKNLLHPAGMYMGGEIIIPLFAKLAVDKISVRAKIKVRIDASVAPIEHIQYLIRHWVLDGVVTDYLTWIQRWRWEFDLGEQTPHKIRDDRLFTESDDNLASAAYPSHDFTGFNYPGSSNDGYWITPKGQPSEETTLDLPLIPDTNYTNFEGWVGTISDDSRYIAISAYNDGLDYNDLNTDGIVEIYKISDEGTWIKQQTLTDPTSSLEGKFGCSLSFDRDGKTLVVGASGDGTVLVYRRDGDTWSLASTISGAASFGTLARISGDGSTIVVSAPNIGVAGKVFRITGAAFDTITELVPITTFGVGAEFGRDLAITNNGKQIFVGVPGHESGAVCEFVETTQRLDHTGSTPVLITPPITGPHRFGSSVDVSANGHVVAIGSETFNQHGAAFIYRRAYTGHLIHDQTFTSTTMFSKFGSTVRLNRSGKAVVVSSGYTDLTSTHPDTVYLFTNQYGTWETTVLRKNTTLGQPLTRRWVGIASDKVLVCGFNRDNIVYPPNFIEVFGDIAAQPIASFPVAGKVIFIPQVFVYVAPALFIEDSLGSDADSVGPEVYGVGYQSTDVVPKHTAWVYRWNVQSEGAMSSNTPLRLFGDLISSNFGSSDVDSIEVDPFGSVAGFAVSTAPVAGGSIVADAPPQTKIASKIRRYTHEAKVKILVTEAPINIEIPV